jgi:hypothetical protein
MMIRVFSILLLFSLALNITAPLIVQCRVAGLPEMNDFGSDGQEESGEEKGEKEKDTYVSRYHFRGDSSSDRETGSKKFMFSYMDFLKSELHVSMPDLPPEL